MAWIHMHKLISRQFSILAGSASFLLPALGVGAVGGICALANVLPDQVCQVYDQFGKPFCEHRNFRDVLTSSYKNG
jgi:dihydrodipicolinate synthase/N-acetylneuraminate lyase